MIAALWRRDLLFCKKELSLFVGHLLLKYGAICGILSARDVIVVYRVLIADSSSVMSKLISKYLADEVEIHRCKDCSTFISTVLTVDPDILYLDLNMTAGMGHFLLQPLRSVGKKMKIIVASTLFNDMMNAQMGQLGVDYLIPKPCSYSFVISLIRELCFRLDNPDLGDWCLENEIDRMLLDLGFRIGPNRYQCVFESVLERYHCPDSSMKELYIDVAKRCGGNYQRIEKAVRDAVIDAYNRSAPEMWELYFGNQGKREKPYPGNEEFIARLANHLLCHSRIRKPCRLHKECNHQKNRSHDIA